MTFIRQRIGAVQLQGWHPPHIRPNPVGVSDQRAVAGAARRRGAVDDRVAHAFVKRPIGHQIGFAAGQRAVHVRLNLRRAQHPAPDLHLIQQAVEVADGIVAEMNRRAERQIVAAVNGSIAGIGAVDAIMHAPVGTDTHGQMHPLIERHRIGAARAAEGTAPAQFQILRIGGAGGLAANEKLDRVVARGAGQHAEAGGVIVPAAAQISPGADGVVARQRRDARADVVVRAVQQQRVARPGVGARRCKGEQGDGRQQDDWESVGNVVHNDARLTGQGDKRSSQTTRQG